MLLGDHSHELAGIINEHKLMLQDFHRMCELKPSQARSYFEQKAVAEAELDRRVALLIDNEAE